MDTRDKPLVWLHGEVKSPPFSLSARIEAGALLRRLQLGESLGMPHSRPLLAVGRKTTRATPHRIIEACGRRLRLYDVASRED